ncbi:MAG: hypothetical protein O8C67_06040 [Candidatus Methanoperedens sp.]|nr:hypothetical protein [Candidatus Methanoperedens sp.]
MEHTEKTLSQSQEEESENVVLEPEIVEPRRGRPPKCMAVTVSDVAGKKPRIQETDLQRRAFETYCSLGENRNLENLAQTMGIPMPTVKTWCTRNAWVVRLREYRNKDVEDQVAEQVLRNVKRHSDLVTMKLSMMTRPDPADPTKEIPTDEFTIFGLKETSTMMLNDMKVLAERLGLKKTRKEIDGGGNGKGPGTGIMVNVIFKG